MYKTQSKGIIIMSLVNQNAVDYDYQIHIDEILDSHKDFLLDGLMLPVVSSEELDDLEFQLLSALRDDREVSPVTGDCNGDFKIAEDFLERYA